MEQITAYKTTDDQIFEDQDLAKKNQDRLDFEKDAEQFCKTYVYDHIEDDMLDVILEQKEALYELLKKHLGNS